MGTFIYIIPNEIVRALLQSATDTRESVAYMPNSCLCVGRSHLFSSLFVTVSWILFDFFSYFKIYFVFPQSILHAGPAFEFIFGCHTAAATKCIFLVVRLRFNRNMFNLRMSNNLDKWARDTCSDTWVIKFDLHRSSLASFVLYGVCVCQRRRQFRRMAHDAVFTDSPRTFPPEIELKWHKNQQIKWAN